MRASAATAICGSRAELFVDGGEDDPSACFRPADAILSVRNEMGCTERQTVLLTRYHSHVAHDDYEEVEPVPFVAQVRVLAPEAERNCTMA